MDNPTLLNSLNKKLVLTAEESSTASYGSGIKIVQTNPTQKQPAVLTTLSTLSTSGARYVIDGITSITLGNFNIITTAVQYKIYASVSGLNLSVRITGVSQTNDEISEVILLDLTNATIPVLSKNLYKCVNDIENTSGPVIKTFLYEIVYCCPVTGQNSFLLLSGLYKVNPFIMGCNKNGVKRTARLVSVGSVQSTAVTDYYLHVFNGQVSGSGSAGIWNEKLNLRGLVNPVVSALNFCSDGIVDLAPGELAVWYRAGNVSTTCNISATWVFFNA